MGDKINKKDKLNGLRTNPSEVEIFKNLNDSV